MHKHTLFHCLIGGLVTVSLAACVWPSPPMGQPVSPPPEILNSPLMDSRWRVEEVTLHGEPVTFDLFRPVYIIFYREGTLRIYSEHCGSGRYAITYQDEQHHRIGEGEGPPEDCGALFMSDDPTVSCTELVGSDDDPLACAQAINAQLGDVNRALIATNAYELRDDALILRGEDAEMRLVLDNPSD